MTRILCPILALAAVVSFAPADEPITDKKEGRYEWKKLHDPDGIGKFYLGREIAHVMSHYGANWLERTEREKEEQPDKLHKAIKIAKGMVVVDMGAGSGYHSFRMSPLVGPSGKVIAVDIQKEMLEIIQKRMEKEGVKNIETLLGEVNDPKLKDNSVDLILMVDVYHEFAQPYEMTQKMVKALKEGGRLVFVEFRLEDKEVPIKLVHKMTERQVIKEMDEFKELSHVETIKDLPWQHVVIFKKSAAKK
jgi:ubiquinone/menaquinone biosynthesis C-methylase UbiE